MPTGQSDLWKTSSDHVEDIFHIRKYQESWTLESSKLRAKTKILERNIRHYGGEDLELLSLRDLQNVEQQLETDLTQIRKKKVSGSDISSFMVTGKEVTRTKQLTVQEVHRNSKLSFQQLQFGKIK
ncbi:truncated transcription factor CAULIFLOWER A-like protein [Tanacetum coccineum]